MVVQSDVAQQRLLQVLAAVKPVGFEHIGNSPVKAFHHAVLCAAGYNIRWLLRMIARKGLGLLLCLLQAAGLTALLAKVAEIIGRNRLQSSDQRWALA